MPCVIIWQLPGGANFGCMGKREPAGKRRALIDPQRGNISAAWDAPDYKLRSCQFN